MKEILVASDFSNGAANALQYALDLAQIIKVDVRVIHAIHPTEGIENSTYNAIFIEDYYNNKREALKAWVSAISSKDEYKGVKVETQCEVGFLGAVLSAYISSKPVEILVMGITGSTSISGIVGSNASMMISRIKIPTLIIPLESKLASNPVITLATDFSSTLSSNDINALNELALALKSEKLHILNVIEKSDSSYTESAEKNLSKLLNNAKLEFNYLTDSNPTNGILEFVEKNETDILCLVKHHHNLLYRIFNRSTVNQVMNKSVKAILVLHE